MNKPNLFSFAKSELSQDAFICWLLSWASPKFKNTDKKLHNCGIKLIQSFFKKNKETTPPPIKEISIKTQYKKIDILCIINDSYPILIEDKVGTQHHSNQLTRYLEEIKKIGYEENKTLPIYFKTEDQSDYSEVEKSGYKVFSRSDFLEVLNTYDGSNEILIDYRTNLQSLANAVESYKHTALPDWDWYSWMGFYIELKKHLKSGNWGYVPNPSGGFLGYWWHTQGGVNDDCEQYLQLEQHKLCFKIYVENHEDRIRLRSKWHKIIQEKGEEYGLDLIKPVRFGNGYYMTTCLYSGEYRKTSNGILDIRKTVENLKKAEALLESVFPET